MKDSPTIQTPRLTLRQARLSDAEAMFRWTSSERVNEFLFYPPNRDEETAKRLLSSWLRRRRNYSWFLDWEGDVVGECQVIKNVSVGGFEIGMTLRDDVWGRGLMGEALTGAILFLFQNGYSFGAATTDERNTSAIRTLESVGFCQIGGPRPYWIAKKGISVNVLDYRLTRENFKKALIRHPKRVLDLNQALCLL